MGRKRERRRAVNRYAQKAAPQRDLDFHGSGSITSKEVKHRLLDFLDDCRDDSLGRVRVITGKGLHSSGKPVVKPQVERTLKQLLRDDEIRGFHMARIDEGGEGAFIIDL